MTTVPRPLLVVDTDPFVFDRARTELLAEGCFRPLMIVSQPAEARQYLVQAAQACRVPVAIVVGPPPSGAASFDLVEWVRGQPPPLAAVPIIVPGDPVLNGEPPGPFDVARITPSDAWVGVLRRALFGSRA